MTRRNLLLTFAAAPLAPLQGWQGMEQAPITGRPKVEVKGKIERVQVSRGQGMPFLEVRTASGISKVALGSVRFLMEQNFNPKAGEEIVVKGFGTDDSVIAISVELTATGKVLKLRDSDGRPVWMRGRYGGGTKNPPPGK